VVSGAETGEAGLGGGDSAGRVALVTGGGTGLGLAISRELARLGFRLAVSYAHSEAEASANLEELRAAGKTVSLHRADIGVPADVDALIEAVYATYGRLDVVINNAGTTRFIPFADIRALDGAVWDEVMDVNLRGTYLVSRAAALRMQEAGGGAIVNVTSTSGINPGGSSIAYAVSKAGIIHLTTCLALALGPDIRVNAVAPSLMLTRWWNGREEGAQQYLEATRFKRAVDLDDVARATVLLATNSSISGQTLAVDFANQFH
jgi:3-oxoacyl-[acyl-carrier protein] reductase